MTDKYEFIAAEYVEGKTANAVGAPSLGQMFGWLGVSKSGYYEWRNRPLSATAERQERLRAQIKTIFEDSDETYGYRRVHAELLCQGEEAGDELIRRLMRGLGLVPCQVSKPKSLTVQAKDLAKIPDLVRRDFTADIPYMKPIADITEIKTWEGKVIWRPSSTASTRKSSVTRWRIISEPSSSQTP
ncbi:IS3 family transposase [Actinomadura gamaensis]|uniref:IS3 family transposase n=1 Tax=Actinomadura gamaensis TaxID=1763541 RepID=A0ABV9TTA4_9ACTN